MKPPLSLFLPPPSPSPLPSNLINIKKHQHIPLMLITTELRYFSFAALIIYNDLPIIIIVLKLFPH